MVTERFKRVRAVIERYHPGVRIAAVEREAGLPVDTLQKWFKPSFANTRKSPPPPQVLARMAEGMGIPARELHRAFYEDLGWNFAGGPDQETLELAERISEVQDARRLLEILDANLLSSPQALTLLVAVAELWPDLTDRARRHILAYVRFSAADTASIRERKDSSP